MQDEYENFNLPGAYAIALALAAIAIVVLVLMTTLRPKEANGLMSISVRNVSKRFGDFVALDDVSIEVSGGSLTALLGPSGSGKSTLLRVIAGLERPDQGTVFIGETDVTGQPPQDREVGFVFQHYAAFKHMTVARQRRLRPQDPQAAARRDPRAGRRSCSSSSSSTVSPTATRRSSPAASGSGWGSRARSRSTRPCCCSTSRSGRSTRRCAPSSAPGCAGCTTRRTRRR